jgi:hypothetical protein
VPSLLHLATLFNVFGSGLVLVLSLVTLRLVPSQFFRTWVWAYAFGTLVTIGSAFEWIAGPTPAQVAFTHLSVAAMLWFECRMVQELLGRPFAGVRVGAGFGLMLASGLGLWLHGAGYEISVIPTIFALVGTQLWLGAHMIWVSRRPEYTGPFYCMASGSSPTPW